MFPQPYGTYTIQLIHRPASGMRERTDGGLYITQQGVSEPLVTKPVTPQFFKGQHVGGL